LAAINEESRGIAILEIIRLRDLSIIKFDENKFLQGINYMFKNLSEVIDNLDYYIEIHKK